MPDTLPMLRVGAVQALLIITISSSSSSKYCWTKTCGRPTWRRPRWWGPAPLPACSARCGQVGPACCLLCVVFGGWGWRRGDTPAESLRGWVGWVGRGETQGLRSGLPLCLAAPHHLRSLPAPSLLPHLPLTSQPALPPSHPPACPLIHPAPPCTTTHHHCLLQTPRSCRAWG